MRDLAGLSLRSRTGLPLLLLIPPLLLALLISTRLPAATRSRAGVEEKPGEVAFSVISIEPDRSSGRLGPQPRRPEAEEVGEDTWGGARADENELHERQVGPRALKVQEWAADEPSFAAELSRILTYIRRPQRSIKASHSQLLLQTAVWVSTNMLAAEPRLQTPKQAVMLKQQQTPGERMDTRKWFSELYPAHLVSLSPLLHPQLNCSSVLPPGKAQPAQPPVASARWLLCAEDGLLPAADTPCVAYSFSLDGGDADFLQTVSRLGCEVHSFNPSISDASDDRLGNSLASNRGNRGGVIQHRMWLEWRAPRRRERKMRGNLGSVSQTLADIMAALGHRTVNFMYADLLSAEWRVFQYWIEVGTLENIHHLVAVVHLHWPGFEVGGTDEEVLRYWFSVLQGIEASGLYLFHSSSGKGHVVLKQTEAIAHSSYTLSWVNTRR